MMINRLQALSLIGIVTLGAATASAQYTYNVGPNYVNQSATSCRADNPLTEKNKLVNHSADGVSVGAASAGTTRFFCPLNVRGHSFYGNPGGNLDGELIVNVQSVVVRAQDGDANGKLGCFAFRNNYPTGSIAFGTTWYVCEYPGGCDSSVSNSFLGVNTLLLTFPQPFTSTTVNFGYVCDVTRGGTIYHAEAEVTPNP